MSLFGIGSSADPYRGEEVLLKKSDSEDVKYLVRWTGRDNEEERVGGEKARGNSHDITMWMTSEELLTCCPHLKQSNVKPSSAADATQEAGVGVVVGVESQEEEESLSEDVTSLILRAKRLSDKLKANANSTGSSSKRDHLSSTESMLSNIVSILAAYADIPSLSDTFKQSGIIDLLLDLLSSRVSAVRLSASDMLCSFASYDPPTRSYVLLRLTQCEEGVTDALTGRDMLMQLFADTSQEEYDEEDNDFLPQVCNLLSHIYCCQNVFMLYIMRNYSFAMSSFLIVIILLGT